MSLRGFVNRLTGRQVPDDFEGTLDDGEYVLASAEVKSGGHMVATSRACGYLARAGSAGT